MIENKNMKAEDLRIGNHLTYGIEKINLKWGFEDFEQVYNDEEEMQYYFPIPLTEEWHNKFGCSLNGFNSFEYKLPRKYNIKVTVIFHGDYVMFRQKSGKHHEDDIVSFWNKDLTKRDMYVHEWQNLYHALTGEELTIK